MICLDGRKMICLDGRKMGEKNDGFSYHPNKSKRTPKKKVKT